MAGDGDGGACLVAACTSEQLRGAPTVPREEGMTRADEERVDAYVRELHGAGYMRPENERWREGTRGRLGPFAGAAARALDGRDRLHGHVKPKKRQVEFLALYRLALPGRGPPALRAGQISAHQGAAREWAGQNNVEALRHFCLAGTNPDHATKARLIRRDIAGATRTSRIRRSVRSSGAPTR